MLRERLADGVEAPLIEVRTAELVQLCTRSDCDLPELSRALARDPSLMARVLQLANSSCFGVRVKISSLERAVVQLGLRRLRELLLLAAARTRLFRARRFRNEMRALCHHSAAAAQLTQRLAELRGADPGAAFLHGLLHDLGWAVALHELEGLALTQGLHRVSGPEEWRVAETLHEEAGVVALRSLLTPELEAAIRLHAVPCNAPTAGDVALATALVRPYFPWGDTGKAVTSVAQLQSLATGIGRELSADTARGLLDEARASRELVVALA